MAPPPPPTELIDDVTAEIFLRLPPDEPEHLFRAALVCKPWLRVLCDPSFLRRYRAFHGAPALLGLLHRLQVLQGSPPTASPLPRRCPTSPARAPTVPMLTPSTAATAAPSSRCGGAWGKRSWFTSSGTPSLATAVGCLCRTSFG
ncbi:unnamed protein product [Urochloa humidicola]